jgi:hypothetical protein
LPQSEENLLRLAILPAALTIAACSGIPPGGEAPAPPPGPTQTPAPIGAALPASAAPIAGTQRAFFTEFPAVLLFASAEACNDPVQTVVRPSRNEVRCETLPAPDAAAALILGYDGTVEDLPRFVIGFRVSPQDGGYVVTAENYVRVPQRTGPARQIRLRDPVIESSIRDLLAAAGGRSFG